MDCASPSLIVINGSIYRKNSFENLAQMVLPSEVELESCHEEEEDEVPKVQLKMKWRAVSRILYAVSSFTPASQVVKEPEKFRHRSWSDPELECRTRNSEDFNLDDIINARRATHTP